MDKYGDWYYYGDASGSGCDSGSGNGLGHGYRHGEVDNDDGSY